MGPKIRNLVLAGLCILYIGLRFWQLTDSCLWFDEIFSVHAAEHSWDTILDFVSLDLIHPPLFYLLLKIWVTIGGEGLLWLRSLPVLCSIAAIVPYLLLCRELRLTNWTNVLALFFIAVNGSLIKYAQEVRMYSMLMCVSLFSIWLFVRYFRSGNGLVILTIVNILLVYTHYFGWFVILSEIVAIVAFQRDRWRPTFVMFSVTFLSFIPWLLAVIGAVRSGSELSQNIGWMQRPSPIELLQLILNLIEPFYYSATSVDPISIYRVSVPILLIATISVCLYFANSKTVGESRRLSFYALLPFLVVPALVAFFVSWILPFSVWGTRHLIIIFAPASILVAFVISEIDIRTLRTCVLSLAMLFTGYAFVIQVRREQPEYIWCAWDELGKQWQTKPFMKPGSTKIYVFEDLVAYHFWFTVRNSPNYEVWKVNGLPGVNEDKAYFLPRGFDSVSRVDEATAFGEESFWVAFRDSDPRASSPGLSFIPYTPPVLTYLIQRGFEVQDVTKMTIGNETAFLVKLARVPVPH